MKIDRARAQKAFADYAAHYNAADAKVKLKIDHTYRVAALCARIAQSLALPPEDVDLAWLSGILHDVGRFEQLRRYNTFIDAQSVSHAALSVAVLFDEGPRRAERRGPVRRGTHPGLSGRCRCRRTAAHRCGMAQRVPSAGGAG